jgi:3-oxoadipate enol-lactonase
MTVALHHVVQGPARATPLVLSHSLGATLAMWDPQAAALAGAYRVVRYDLRGHGLSPVPPGPYQMADLGADLIALLDRLGIERAHLVGLSLGAMVSLWVAAYHGNRVNRLVVCSTSAALGPPQAWADRAAQVRAGGTAIIADEVVARWFTPAYRQRHPARVAEMRALIAATPAEGYAACCGAIETMDLRPALAAITAPTLAIAAAGDPSTPPPHLQAIAQAIPGSQMVVVEEAAHLVNVEQAPQVNQLLAAHLRTKGDSEHE